jgi:PKD repeat protein
MLPEQPISFPEFVADQLLTASNLNDLFHYLDVQERGTRTNLIGIGIVCGLELKVNSTGTEITISKGCGITTQGYLVRWDEATFQNYKAYDAAKELVYPPFYSNGKQKLDIDELKSNASEEGIIKLTASYLADKVALLFVELLEMDSKNCDPESCDDKGKNITLTIRPLLVKKSDAVYLTGGVAGTNSFNQAWVSLPETRMPRHHVPADDIFDSGDVFAGFQDVLNAAFLGNLEKNLGQVYTRLSPLVKDIYASNPFNGLASDFAFIHDGTITVQQLLYMQYFYDLFSDVIYAYEELRKVGMRLLSLCCPDENLFPRHLLLGVTGPADPKVKADFRHYFIQSPAVACHGDLVGELRLLFKRMVLLLQRFSVQTGKQIGAFDTFNEAALNNRSITTAPIRITPSKLGDVPLSEKSIPFYYNAASGTDKLYQHWNFYRSRNGSANHILSYNAAQYNSSDDEVLHPLRYDLEPYNFLRIEGHVGHNYVDALATINQIRDTNRLPFDVVALSADIRTLREQLASIANSTNRAGLSENVQGELSMMCHFQDLEALYDTIAQAFLCNLCKEMKYYYDIILRVDNQSTQTFVPAVPLLKKCDPSYRYKANSLGAAFEVFYKKLPQNYIEVDQFLSGTALGNANGSILKLETDNNAALLAYALLYYIEKTSEILTTTLATFNIAAFVHRYSDLMTVAQKVKEFQQMASIGSAGADNELALAISEDIIDHLDSLLYACKDTQLLALYNDYKLRWLYLSMLQKFGYYVKLHPGIQHKAGVPVGGTFLIVYHERPRTRTITTNIFTRDRVTELKEARTVATTAETAKTAKTFKAGTQPEAMAPSVEDTVKEAAATAAGDAISAGDKVGNLSETTQARATYAQAAYDSLHRFQTAKLKVSLSAKQMSIIDKLFFKDIITKHSLDELTAALPDKIVIADFYLPYMCCSDCPPVYYIVNETKDTEQPTISIKDLQYCNGDKTAYPVTVTPTGGTASGEGVTTAGDGSITFNPSAVIITEGSLNKVVAITYTKDDQSVSVNVTVFAKPTADFDVVPATTYNLFVFNNKSLNAASISWDFGDGITGTGDHPSHSYAADGTYTIKLTATNGVCTDTATQTVNVVKATIVMDGKEFCSADKTSYPVNVTPAGGTVTGDGTGPGQATGSFVFTPAKIAFGATDAQKDVTISYSLQGQFVQTTVRVYQTPSASFTIGDAAGAAGGNIKTFTTGNKFPVQYSWDFGDGAKSVEANPVHQYTQPGTFVVALTVTNGTCTDTTTQTITIAPASISIKPAQFCSADTQNYPITVSPAGGNVSGETVINTGTGFVFRPNAVVFNAQQPQKDITLAYTVTGQNVTTQVTVFRTPNAAFTVTAATAPNTKTFNSNIGFVADINWDFGDGATSKETNPTHVFSQPGTYKVALTVVNGTCNASTSQSVTIVGDNTAAKTCTALGDIVASFKALPKVNAAQFKIFTKKYSPYPDIDKFFSDLGTLSTATTKDQIKFFTQVGVADMLVKWFAALNPLVQNSDVRQVAIAMWRVLTDLAMYIMCIQDGDFKDDDINLAQLFELLASNIADWQKVVANFSKDDKAQLQLLLNDMIHEHDQVVKNGEDKKKPAYMASLERIIDMLKKYVA